MNSVSENMFATTMNFHSSGVTIKKGIGKGIFSRLRGLWHLIDLNLAHRKATVRQRRRTVLCRKWATLIPGATFIPTLK